MFNIGPAELLVILLVALIIFGPGKLPEVGRALGRTINEFRRASQEIETTSRPSPPAKVSQPAAPEPPANQGESESGQTSPGQDVAQVPTPPAGGSPAGGERAKDGSPGESGGHAA